MGSSFAILLDRVLLRPLAEEDKVSVARFAGDPEAARATRSVTYPEDPENAFAWVEEHIAKTAQGQTLSLAIIEREQKRFLGAVILFLEPRHERAEIGLWIGRPFWSKGYGTEAARGVIDYAFGRLGLHKICAYCLATNLRSLKLIQGLGMTFEGRQRKQLKIGNDFEDLMLFGLLAEEWKSASRAQAFRAEAYRPSKGYPL